MKKEKELMEFFDRYSEQLIPEDQEQFMESLKDKMQHLPVPSAFNEMDPEMSKEYARWLIDKMKKEYRRQKKEAVISCLFTIVIVAALTLVLRGLGVFSMNSTITVIVLAIIGIGAAGLITSTTYSTWSR